MKAWTVAGLVVAMIGTGVTFRWGLPPARYGVSYLLLESSPSNEEVERKRRQQGRIGKLGLALIGVGFALQTVGALLA